MQPFFFLLLSENVIQFLSEQISLLLDINVTPDVSISTVWEALKAYLQGQVISFVAKKWRHTKVKQLDLESQIGDIL